MSQASGAARETSMDEILASIRKIIEESDAAASAAEAEGERTSRRSSSIDLSFTSSEYDDEDEADNELTGLSDILDADDQIDDEIVAAGEAELNAFREAINDRDPVTSAKKADSSASPAVSEDRSSKSSGSGDRRPLSLADIQAQLSSRADELDSRPADAELAPGGEDDFDASEKSASDDLEDRSEPADVADDTLSDAPPTAISSMTVEPDESEAEPDPSAEKQSDDVGIEEQVLSEDRFRAVAERLDRRTSNPEMSGRRAPMPVNQPSATQPASDVSSVLSPIVSQEAGKAVADSFGQLKEAFFASRQRNFDEMAEEMLRPMLQDWLDNNLPTLVERLVKEEIERIAQGG
ncbi:DUF2497 domain-containing protein [Notoacmeibacter sp. MSK16QG-6]|uniref:DUF2497 domain-containing protein n=1 Tax=Notoacmeibacter sp. MSK16QG-6 TaxID=2957982 RepID=UPI00209E862C|nr:DUF2497 domain-containing protein [Notoacmeibacter sp. MSK16QG-6]MCP1199401.1 DUF2497 domain-containing protein [Notoacmeibacter sp. MSK16QG-6]